jgi:hypothetical protein
MIASKLTKSPNLGVIFQITEVTTAAAEERLFEVHDVERGRGFRVTLAAKELEATPAGAKARKDPWSDDEVEATILVALERELQEPPPKVAGETYAVTITSEDLHSTGKQA